MKKIYIVEQVDRSTGDYIFETVECFDNKQAAVNALYNLAFKQRQIKDPNYIGFYFQINEIELQSECNLAADMTEIFKEEMHEYLKGVKFPYKDQEEIYYHMFDFGHLEGQITIEDITYEYKYNYGEIIIKCA